MSVLKNTLLALAVGVFFALLYAAGVLGPMEERIYDFFLRGRPDRERINNVVFLDVDDTAIAYNGVYPWPRSIVADGYIRLKEYGVAAAIMDIEFIDKGPPGIDSIYFNRDFPADFEKTFSEIGGNVSEFLGALRGGRINRTEAARYEQELLTLIRSDGEELFQKASGIARDNDIYLAQASALFGRTWATLNLQSTALSGEQAERRPLAEEKFSYPVDAAPGLRGGDFVDILPPIPSFAEAARGAGFTNVFIDDDGVRRRIFLAQKIGGNFYLQLALAPLMEYLGYPEIRLEKRRLILKNVRFPAAGSGADSAPDSARDIVIPLDTRGRMMLDWPKTDYRDSFAHISFAELSWLEELESQIEQYLVALGTADFSFFARFDESLYPAVHIVYQSGEFLRESREALGRALAEKSDDEFNRRLALRAEGMALLESFSELETGPKVLALLETLERDYPEDAGVIRGEAEYIAQLAEYLDTAVEKYTELNSRLRDGFAGKFCIIGRVDTGTTDIGVNPFYGEYVNVGTHAVVLDTILRESFINPLHLLWSALLCLVLPLLLMLALSPLKLGPRVGLGIGGLVFFGAACFILFRYTGIFISPLGPVLSGFVAVIIRELISYLVSEKEKQFINKALSTYVSKEVVEELVANPSLLQLGGSKRQMSAVFTDIQGFSTISEQLDPEHLVRLLNRYLTAMSDIIMENTGTIDKYEGDAIVAFFGAPVYREDHAARACRSAIRMKKAETELNRELIGEGLITGGVLSALKNKGVKLDADAPIALYTRIGINTGEMVVGNMGTSNKMNYTIMGNAVNLAARLEGVNKQYDTGGILISEYTKNEIGGEFICRSLDRVRVVGINTPVRLYELMEFRGEAGAAEQEAFAAWEKALSLYESREFQGAEKIFHSLAARNEQDRVARLYADRCRAYIAAPPPDDWDGVNNLSQK
ncbi:MAG: adenylate/guanylate cyclase domain-containing protein [Treponema sp.]|jgi:adenylate cyclase|nr:adenylate/guanylate cyclase domain-containing protein [Treponema sp.]